MITKLNGALLSIKLSIFSEKSNTIAMSRINVVDSRVNNTDLGAKIGYLRLKQFNAKSPKEMSLSIMKLEKVLNLIK